MPGTQSVTIDFGGGETLAYQGDIIPYLDGTNDPTLDTGVTAPTVNPGVRYRTIELPSGIYSVGNLTSDAGNAQVLNGASAAITARRNAGYWLVVKPEPGGRVVIDFGLNRSGLIFTGGFSAWHNLALVNIEWRAGSIQTLGPNLGASGINLWYCRGEYTAAQWLDNVVAAAAAAGGVAADALLETAFYKDPGRGSGGLFNHGYYFVGSTCIDAVATQAALGAGAVSGDTVTADGWMNTAGTGGKSAVWQAVQNEMGSWLPTPVRLQGAGSASSDLRFFGCTFHGSDDAVYAGAVYYQIMRGCHLFVQGSSVDGETDPDYRGEFVYNAVRDEWVSIDPGVVTGDEKDQFHNDAWQIGPSGYRPIAYHNFIGGRIIFNQAPNPSKRTAPPGDGSGWGGRLGNCMFGGQLVANGAGPDNDSILGDGTTNVAGSPDPYPSGVGPWKTEAAFLLALNGAGAEAVDMDMLITDCIYVVDDAPSEWLTIDTTTMTSSDNFTGFRSGGNALGLARTPTAAMTADWTVTDGALTELELADAEAIARLATNPATLWRAAWTVNGWTSFEEFLQPTSRITVGALI